jgi:long-chain acyl-CoA synthetase
LKITATNQTAFIWKDKKYQYSQLLQRVHHFSTLLNNDYDKVAIFAPNSPDWAFSFFSAWENGSIAVPIDFMSPADEVAYILNDCRAEVIFCSEETVDIFKEAQKTIEYDVELLVLEDIQSAASEIEARDLEISDPEKTAVIIYTSGTTGSPKGVMLSYDNLMANIEAVSDHIPIYTPDRKVLALLPFHHIFPLLGTLVAPIYVGATIAFSPTMKSEDIISTLQDNKIAIIIGVPRLYAAIRKGIMNKINAHFATRAVFSLAKTINSRAFSKKLFKKVHERFGGNVQYMVCGGAKLDEDVARDYCTLGFEMLEGFGMTEAAPMITFTRPGKWKIGAAGQSMPNLEVAIKDGQIVAKGRNIMQGYFNRPEETADVLKDGWLHTGDLGHLDKNGFLHITGRSKEIIVLGSGKNINPEEIEKKLADNSDLIAEVGVFMRNDSLQAAIFPDFVRIRDKGIQNLEEVVRWDIIDAYNKKAAHYKKISQFILLKEELPKTRLGKTQRFKLAELAEQSNKSAKEKGDEPQFEEYVVIRDFLHEQTSKDIFPDDHLEIDLGLDSLDKVSLQTFLQSTFGINIQENVLLNHPTVEKLSNFMKEKKNKLSVEAVKWAEIFKENVDLKLPKSWFTQNLFKYISRAFFALYFRLKGEGTENIPDGPFILAPNHQSYFDGLFVSVFLKRDIIKNTYFYAKEKHVRKRWIRAIANRNNVIILDINNDLKASLQKLAKVLKKGKNVIIFPEGTRTRSGNIGRFKKSFAILSREMNVPIVPVSIKGAFEALPRGSKLPRPWKKINVKFHKPIYPENLTYEALTKLVYERLASELA